MYLCVRVSVLFDCVCASVLCVCVCASVLFDCVSVGVTVDTKESSANIELSVKAAKDALALDMRDGKSWRMLFLILPFFLPLLFASFISCFLAFLLLFFRPSSRFISSLLMSLTEV